MSNGLLQEQQLGKMFSVKPGPTFEDTKRHHHAALQQWEPIIDRVTDLFLRMRTQQAEVAATVHFVAQSLSRTTGKPSEVDVFEEVKRWKQRRRPALRDDEIAQAVRNLNLLRWLDLKLSTELPLPEEATLDA